MELKISSDPAAEILEVMHQIQTLLKQDKKITMEQIAASLNTNPDQLNKMFIKEVGITFAQYLRESKQSSH